MIRPFQDESGGYTSYRTDRKRNVRRRVSYIDRNGL